jgi:hypothetical protein
MNPTLSLVAVSDVNAFGRAGSDAALVIATVYITQLQSAAWYVKFTPRMFGQVKPQLQAT